MICPFCHTDNDCSVSEGQSCWCFTITIPDDMLKLLPDQEKGTSCICQTCVELYNDDSEKFTRRYYSCLNPNKSNNI